METLLVRSGKKRGKRLLLPENKEIAIGRDSVCDIRVPSPDVSNIHCILRTSVEGVLVTRGVRETTGEPFREQSEALHGLLSLRRLRRCAIDAGGLGMAMAESAVEAFGSSRVEAVTFTAAVKDELASRLRLRIEDGTIRIPVDEAIRNDWHSVRRSVTSTGPARYDASRSGLGHADRFWAACLAVRAAAASPGVIEGARGGPLRFFRRGIW